MTDRLFFSIPGEPRAKGRARHVARIVWKDGRPEAFVRVLTPADTISAEAEIAAIFRAKFPRHRLWTGPIMLRFTAVFETPATFNRALKAAAAAQKLYCTKKPDKDNIEKLITDALNGVAWADDCQVMGGGIKRYGSPARVDVTIERLDDPEIPVTPGQKSREKSMGLPDSRQGSLALRRNPSKSGKAKA